MRKRALQAQPRCVVAVGARACKMFSLDDNQTRWRHRQRLEQVDDETDEDTMAALLDKHLPPGVVMCNGGRVPGGRPALANAQVRCKTIGCLLLFHMADLLSLAAV